MLSQPRSVRMVEADINPYGTDIVDVLEDEITMLLKELEYHKKMSKVKVKGPNIHKKMLVAKERSMRRLLDLHPDGEEFLFDL